jgi:hypothetical protein
MSFATNFKHTNVVIVNIPVRYDLGNDSASVNKTKKIERCNEKLNQLIKSHPHVTVFKASTNRDHFTRHGLHLNKYGKRELAKQIGMYLNLDQKLVESSDSSIPLPWKPNTESEPLKNVDNLQNVTCANIHRISSRNKKTPVTRNADFLWEDLTSAAQNVGMT